MSSATVPLPTFQSQLLHPILVGGALAGAFDLTSAMITMAVGNPRLIAGGLLGKQALQGGAGTLDARLPSALLHRVLSRHGLLPFQVAGWSFSVSTG